MKALFQDFQSEHKLETPDKMKYDWTVQKEKILAEKIRLEEEER